MVTERNVIGRIEVLEDGRIQLREDVVIERDGVEISRLYHRRVLEPTATHSESHPRLVSIIDAVWTAEVIDEWQRKKEEMTDGIRN